MTDRECPLRRAHDRNAVIIRMDDLDKLRAAARPKKGAGGGTGASDSLLFYAFNSELSSFVGLAWCVDDQDSRLLAQQNSFKTAYANLRDSIAKLQNTTLRMSVELPAEYITRIETNWLLDYAKPKKKSSRNWKRDELFIRLLALHALMIGEIPKATEGGPSERFIVAIVDMFRRYIQTAPDQSSEEFKSVIRLIGYVRDQGPFLKEWWRAAVKASVDVEGRVSALQANLASEHRRLGIG